MKKTKIFLALCISIILVLTLFFNTRVLATDIEENEVEEISEETSENTEEENITEENEESEETSEEVVVYEGDLYVLFSEDANYSNTTYVMDKYVDGNVFILGQDVVISGQVNGSLFVLASNVTIEETAYIGCHIFICADSVTMSGFTYDMYVATSYFNLTQNGIIYRDLKLGADTAYLHGSVGRDVDMAVDNILSVYEDADNCLYVGGDLNYTFKSEIENLDQITVYGEVTYTERTDTVASTNKIDKYVSDGLENIVFTLVVYTLLIFLAPKFIEKSKQYVSTKSLLALAIGLMFTIVLPILALLLLFTILGASIAITAVMIYVVILMINCAIVTIMINEFISSKIPAIDKAWKKILMIIPVALVIFLLRQIPYVGAVITILIFLVGVGTTILYQFDKRENRATLEE